jgi:hypothetical protein
VDESDLATPSLTESELEQYADPDFNLDTSDPKTKAMCRGLNKYVKDFENTGETYDIPNYEQNLYQVQEKCAGQNE